MMQHWIGLFHAITRTILVTAAWFLLPAHRFTVIPVVIVFIYLVSIVILLHRARDARG